MRERTVREIMSRDLKVVPTTMPLRELATFLTDHQISGAPVENETGELVGVVSVTDVALSARAEGRAAKPSQPAFYSHGGELAPFREQLAHLPWRGDDLTVEDVMTPSIFAVEADASCAQAASVMVSGHLHRVLVVDGDRVAGILSSTDLLRLLY